MGSDPQVVDLDALGKLLSLAKGLEELFKEIPQMKAIERVLIRTSAEGKPAFQVKGGMLWRFFTITLPGREKEYDLGLNLAQLANLFKSIQGPSDQEIRRAAQGMAMYGDTVIDTQDAIASLIGLQTTLNSIIDHVKQKKLRGPGDEARKKSISDTLEAMKINWRHVTQSAKSRKKKAISSLEMQTA